MMAGAAHTEQMVAWGRALASAVKGPVMGSLHSALQKSLRQLQSVNWNVKSPRFPDSLLPGCRASSPGILPAQARPPAPWTSRG